MLRLVNITKHYKVADTTVEALKGINLSFRKNEFVSILGPSGCGKTTLLNIIGGLDKYTSGDLFIAGRSTKEFKDGDWDIYRNHRVGFIFQSYNLIPHQTILGNVELALTIAGMKKSERIEKAKKALDKVGLAGQYNKRPNQLSGGQCQRVAIARALVNDPEILLADEPTGALDTTTSVQIMELIKEIANDRLVIMVTHNPELAEKYSTRIIKLLDGQVEGDSNEYSAEEEKQEVKKLNKESKQSKNINENKDKPLQVKKEKAKMSFFTAFRLSFQNLFSKKGRTILTSIAGAIGIIGVSLVLAVSVGLTNYINNLQADALGSAPITVTAISLDTSKLSNMSMGGEDIKNPTDDSLYPYDPMAQFTQFGHYNNLNKAFLDHVKAFEQADSLKGDKSQLNSVEYKYHAPIKLVSKVDEGSYKLYKSKNQTNIMTGQVSGEVYQLINNMDYVMQSYDLIYGTLPTNNAEGYSTQMVLVVGKGNQVPVSTLEKLGISFKYDNATQKYATLDFEELCNKEFKLLYNDDYYRYDSVADTFDTLKEDSITLQTVFENASTTLKISGVIRLKDDASSSILSTGLAYMPSLGEHYLNNCKASEIAQKQQERKDSGNLNFYDPFTLSLESLPSSLTDKFEEGFSSVTEMNQYLLPIFHYTLAEDDAYQLGLQQIGASELPVSISFYPKTFDAKDAVLNMIKSYNANAEQSMQIVYADTTQFLTLTLGKMINIVSYALIAFACISLLVSCVMIGIITHVSVVERTKEIGVIRSLGGRKRDVVHLFNAETFIIGFTSGLIGIAITYIICLIANLIVKAVSTISAIAIFPWHYALIMLFISIILTLISGLFPSLSAAKKDPVVALRTE